MQGTDETDDSGNYFSAASDNYRQFRPRYPDALYDYLASLAPDTGHAWDCGCGNGQAATALALRFRQVTATDVSAAQIAQAEQRENIDYRVSPAERIDTADASLDLIAVAQAIHWFDHTRFNPEVDRTLKPGGILAAWGYQLLNIDTQFDDFIIHFHGSIIGRYWPKGRELLDDSYSRITLPYPRLSTPDFRMDTEWTLEQLLGYLQTWSAVKAYARDRGRNPVSEYEKELRHLWGAAKTRKVHWPLIVYVGRKPD